MKSWATNHLFSQQHSATEILIIYYQQPGGVTNSMGERDCAKYANLHHQQSLYQHQSHIWVAIGQACYLPSLTLRL